MRTYEVKKWTDLELILIELLNEFIIQIPDQLLFNPRQPHERTVTYSAGRFIFTPISGKHEDFPIFA